MNGTAKPQRRAKRPGTAPLPRGGASEQARRQAAAILEVLAGVRRPGEAAQVLGTSLPRYYQLSSGPWRDSFRLVSRLRVVLVTTTRDNWPSWSGKSSVCSGSAIGSRRWSV